MHTLDNQFASTSSRDAFGHWILLGDYEAEAFVYWLMNDSGLSKYEIIDELEYQINKPDVGYQITDICYKALNAIPIPCAHCGRTILYGEANSLHKYKTEKHSDVVSRSLVGGTTFRKRTSMTYIARRDYICDECFAEYTKKYKEGKEKRGIKSFFKKLFG